MPDKKKTAAPKGAERRTTKPPASTPSKPSEPARAAAHPPESAVAVALPPNPQNQLKNFEAAVKLFHARKFREARDLFLTATHGPERDVAQRARLHIAMCERRLEKPPVALGSAEDCYNYGVALINTRSLAEARAHLQRGLEMAPDADHIHYALALAHALGGDSARAFDSLKRAIELEPRNRLIARQDADFAPIANQPPLDALLYPEKKGW
ncbi:MAG TPA: tetratricopeptide repeat protein [Bryobacteraceae bacterium]|nr:tetratricopeptide repeat protein [Bryobacteraceae bacterium]